METTIRQSYLDWLRIAAIAGVLLFHSSMPYVAEWSWHIKNADTSNLMLEVAFFFHLVRMPLLFFISGTVSYYMMQRRSGWAFIGLRMRRLFIPLVVGMFIIVPPQVYAERVTQGYAGSFWTFYTTRVLQFVPYPNGNFSWHHLWFICYLLVYDLLFAPVFAWMASPRSLRFREVLAVLAKGKRVLLLMVPGVLWFAGVARVHYETNDLVHDGGYFVYWLFFVLAGFVCIAQPKLMDALERNRRAALGIGFSALLVLDWVRWTNQDASPWWPCLDPLVAYGWVMALAGYGKRYLNRYHPSLEYLNQAVYPFYILHQTVIVLLTFVIVQLPHETILSKYLFTVAFTLFISMGIYHLFIRPFGVMRLLFGMKPLPKTKKSPQENKLPGLAISA